MATRKSRREEYSEATREGLIDSALRLFFERGYSRTSLDDVVAATRVTKGALYHHFEGKRALFEAVYDRLGQQMQHRVTTAAAAADNPWHAALGGMDAFLDFCCEPPYARIVMQEAPVALGYRSWRECEEKYAYGLTQAFLESLVQAGIITSVPLHSATQLTFAMFGGAAMAIAEAPEEHKTQVRDETAALMRRFLEGLRA